MERILVIAAHSDDQILGPGGTLAKYAKEGKEIKTVIFSYGENSHPHLKREVIVKKRVEEAQKADKIIGGNGVIFLGINEGKFNIEEKKIITNLTKIINEFNPDKIFTHSDEDPHPDHRAVCRLTKKITTKIKFKGEIYIFDVWNLFSMQNRNLPKLYIDITKTFKTKIKAINSFSSQWVALIMLKWSVYWHAIWHGFVSKYKYAERFYKIK